MVSSPGGLSVHLIEPRELHTSPAPTALCGSKASQKTRTWFALNGCRRCCRAALKQGIVAVVDTDGRIVKIDNVLNGIVDVD